MFDLRSSQYRPVATAMFVILCGCSKQAPPPPGPPTVEVRTPTSVSFQENVEYTGRLEASQRVEVRARVSGYLQEIKFRDGDWVAAGTELFVVDPRPFEAARERAAATLSQARARSVLAVSRLQRSQSLREVGASSVEDLELAQSEHDSAVAALAAAEAELRLAELDLSFTRVTAPIAGRVSDRRIDIGNFVQGGSADGTLLTTIVALDPIRVTFEITEADALRLQAAAGTRGMKIPVRVGTEEGWSRSASLDFIDNEENPRSGTVRLRARLDNSKHELLPAYFARVQLPIGTERSVLAVPDAAVVNDQNRKLVLLVDSRGKVEGRPIEAGPLIDTRRVVHAGLSANDRVIVGGVQRARPGDIVNATDLVVAAANRGARP